MRMKFYGTAVALAVALAVGGPARAISVEAEALRAKKGVLILQCGSDWCVSGESVRGVFESTAFKKGKVAQKYALATYDEMDNPTPAAKAKNEDCKSLLIRTKRFPAITCYTPEMKVFAQIENVPYDVDVESLSRAIARVTKRKDEAEALFKKAATLKGEEAADAYGQGFDILAAMMTSKNLTSFHFNELTTGKHGWRKEWDALTRLDAGDRYGWLAHFRMDEYETVRLVEKVTNLKEGSSGQARALVDQYKAIPDAHFSPNQKQCVKVMEYALGVNGTNGALDTVGKRLMREAYALGEDTFWGQFAKGRLMADGEKLESKGLPAAKVRPRPTTGSTGAPPAFLMEQVRNKLKTVKPGAPLTDAQKLDVARYAVLRLIGPKGWTDLCARKGGTKFIKAFMDDRVWLEDFAYSGDFPQKSGGWNDAGAGPGAGAGAALALEALVFQDGGRWTPCEGGTYADNEGRRFMTALAINYPDRDEAWQADVLDAYRSTALAERLHRSAYTQPVWLWRYATHTGHPSSGTPDTAAQHRHLNRFVNLPEREYGGTCWMIVYRLKNCFGDSVHGPFYYKAWATAGDWPKRRYSQIVGGVCGELSKFGSATSNAHGLPSTTVGQPGHCAYSRRRTNGTWELNYSVTGHSQLHLCFWNHHEWQYVAALESTFSTDRETRLAADRQLTLAALSEDLNRDAKIVEKFYQSACVAHRGHYGAWKEYGAWLMRSNSPLDKIKVWVRGCARGLKAGRQPLWDILTPYFARVAREKGKPALKDELIEFAPLLRQGGDRLQEESDFSTVLNKWGEALGGDPNLRYDVLKAMMAAQVGTRDYFSQAMSWGSEFFSKTAQGVQTFTKCLGEALAAADAADAKGKKGKGGASGVGASIDFGPLILGASRNGNREAFQQMAKLQAKLAPPATRDSGYGKSDFGGELLCADGMLRTSSTCGHDHPANYPFALDLPQPTSGAAFHTESEEAPWAEVTLAGPSTVAGIVLDNNFGQNAGRQVPIEVSVSEDGKEWTKVYTNPSVEKTYRVDLRGHAAAARVQYVRVARTKGAGKNFFHLNKILVYGKKLY